MLKKLNATVNFAKKVTTVRTKIFRQVSMLQEMIKHGEIFMKIYECEKSMEVQLCGGLCPSNRFSRFHKYIFKHPRPCNSYLPDSFHTQLGDRNFERENNPEIKVGTVEIGVSAY